MSKADTSPTAWTEPTPEETVSDTYGRVSIEGRSIPYRATAGTYLLKEDNGRPKARIFHVAYRRLEVGDASRRPIAFVFNGGPGSSSVWLHLGTIGPRRVRMEDGLEALKPPFALEDNAYSLLDQADLVFIDPVSTGYSRPAPEVEAKEFHGVERDVESVGEFIRLWVTREKRWGSPKFLIGESYGTTRAASLAGHLQGALGMYLNGIALISVVLDFSTIRFDTGNDLPHILYLPTYAATAHYHGASGSSAAQSLDELLQEAEDFARGDYAGALFQGSSLDAEQRRAAVRKMAELTGLAPEYVDGADLRVDIMRFAKELLRSRRLTVGRFDSRATGRDRDAVGEHFEYDPSSSTIQGAFTAMLNAYLRGELRFRTDAPYNIITSLYQTWDYSKHANRYLNVAETLRAAMVQNPHLKVLAACGLYDMATPYFATEYTLNHLGLPADLQDNVRVTRYPAGHMMYTHYPSLVQLKADLARLVEEAS